MHADVRLPSGARPSTGTMLSTRTVRHVIFDVSSSLDGFVHHVTLLGAVNEISMRMRGWEPLNPDLVDYFTVSLRIPNGICQPLALCKWAVSVLYKSKFPEVTWAHCESHVRILESIFGPTNHTAGSTANWRPCPIPHWESGCQQARVVKQSTDQARFSEITGQGVFPFHE